MKNWIRGSILLGLGVSVTILVTQLRENKSAKDVVKTADQILSVMKSPVRVVSVYHSDSSHCIVKVVDGEGKFSTVEDLSLFDVKKGDRLK